MSISRPTLALVALLGPLALVAASPGLADEAGPAPGERAGTLVVTTSMLAEVSASLLPGEGGPRVVTLIPPGSCPGHFDLSPRDLVDLDDALLLVRHDYQGALEQRLRRGARELPAVVAARTSGSLLVPDNLAAFARGLADALDERLPAAAALLDERLGELVARAEQAGQSARERAAPLAGTRVVASAHQAEFARYLGLEVVATLARPEDLSARELAGLAAADAALVVANLQEGTDAALALGERLDLPVAVFSNFPGAPGYGQGYAELLEANVAHLEAALARR